MYNQQIYEELSDSESYAWGIIRYLLDLTWMEATKFRHGCYPPTGWLARRYPTVSSVGMAFRLMMFYIMEFKPLSDKGYAYIDKMTDVMEIAGFSIYLGNVTQKPGPMYVLAEAVCRSNAKAGGTIDIAIEKLKAMIDKEICPPEMISLPEYAELHRREPSGIRKMALDGRLKTARKVGGRWRVNKEEPCPEDGRGRPVKGRTHDSRDCR